MKKFLLVICLAMAAVMVVTPAFAEELWDFHLRGVDEGLAAGALPPPGFYFINDAYFAPSFHGYDSSGHAEPGVKLFAYVDVPILLWTPGLKFLGADYGVAVAEPFDFTSLRIDQGILNEKSGVDKWIGHWWHKKLNPLYGKDVWETGAQWGAYNTVLVPVILSWKLPCDFRVKAAFDVGLDDATTAPGDSQSGGPYAQSGNGYYSFTPNIGISWLHAGWNVSADFFYTWALKNDTTDYQSADEFAADYTITYTWKKWTFGLGAAQENQVGNDSQGGITLPGTKVSNYSLGPIVGYNFGPCSMLLTYNFPLATKSDVGGEWFNFRIIVPLGNPCPLGSGK